MKKLVLLLGLIASHLLAQAGSYKAMNCEGTMPSHMQRLLSSDKLDDYESDVRSLLSSGNVLYGTPVNKYIEQIADVLYKANPQEDHKKINIYLYKSDEVNAFMCKDGTLIVNLGLVAQASSEAEIALVLAHEIEHFDKKHISKINKKDLKKSKDIVDYVLKKTQQDREKEMEADSYALKEFYTKTNYSYEAVPGLFDLLQYGYLPFDEVAFDRNFVETKDYKFPDNYFLTKLVPIKSREDYVDTLSTHPNLLKRRENADNIVKGLDDKGRTEFSVGETAFDNARLTARKEVINLELKQHEFGQAFYNTYVLLSETPNDPELKYFITSALYGLSKYAHEAELNDVLPNYKDTEGESGAAYYFLKKLTKKELNVLALRFAWEQHQANPDDTYMTDVVKDLMKDFRGYNLSESDFCDFSMGTNMAEAQKTQQTLLGKNTEPKEEVKAEVKPQTTEVPATKGKNNRKRNVKTKASESTVKAEVKEETVSAKTEEAPAEKNRRSKYDKIKQKRVAETIVLPDSDFTTLNYMLVDLKKDTAFMSTLSKTAKSDEQKEVKSILDAATEKKSDAVAFDGGNVLLVTYYFSDKNTAAKKDKNMQNDVIKWGAKIGINFICYEQLLKEDPTTKNYNMYTYVKDIQQQNLMSSGKAMVNVKIAGIDSIMKANNIKKMLDLRVVDMLYDKCKMKALIGGILIPYALPEVIAQASINKRILKSAAVFTDLETGNTDNSSSLTAEGYNSQSRLHEFLYEFLTNVKEGK